MAIRKCLECGKEVSTDARACPHCGKQRPTRRISPWMVALIVVVLLYIIGKDSDSPGSGASTPASAAVTAELANRNAYRDAYRECERFVRLSLKAPSTAKFSGRELDRQFLGSEATITGYVDAENSFGAKLRSYFTCEATRGSDGTVTVGLPNIKQR